ncbi:DUF202 domain-containing protein [Rhodococcus sp. 14C212]|nr:DUF202 domain-containing protein [Rhodococcus sp. 14C212]
MSRDTPWPSWVYREGTEPDYRFSFANERTFLAWIRTSFALLAAGAPLDIVNLSLPHSLQRLLGILLVGASMIIAVTSWLRWARAEIAIRRGEPLPGFRFGIGLSALTVVSALIITVAL